MEPVAQSVSRLAPRGDERTQTENDETAYRPPTDSLIETRDVNDPGDERRATPSRPPMTHTRPSPEPRRPFLKTKYNRFFQEGYPSPLVLYM